MIHGREIFHGQSKVSDIDIALDESPTKNLLSILLAMENRGVIKIIQCLHYDVYECYYYILEFIFDGVIEFIHLDCMYDPIGIGRYGFRSANLLKNRHLEDGIYAPTSSSELVYLTIKKIVKGSFDYHSIKRIRSLYELDKNEGSFKLQQYLPKSMVDEIVGSDEDLTADDLNSRIYRYRRGIKRKKIESLDFRVVPGFFAQVLRMSKRLISPSGAFVVFLGPDGSGKTSMAELVVDKISSGYRKTSRFHWRPELLPKPRLVKLKTKEEILERPQLQSKYGVWVSVLRFGYYYIDFTVGYWVKLFPKKARTTLIIGERYYYDILVHPQRYGFKLPQRILNFGLLFVPSPDLVILLENEPEVIVARKDELPLYEVVRQLSQYKKILSGLKHSKVISTDGDIDEVAKKVAEAVLECTAMKNRRHYL